MQKRIIVQIGGNALGTSVTSIQLGEIMPLNNHQKEKLVELRIHVRNNIDSRNYIFSLENSVIIVCPTGSHPLEIEMINDK